MKLPDGRLEAVSFAIGLLYGELQCLAAFRRKKLSDTLTAGLWEDRSAGVKRSSTAQLYGNESTCCLGEAHALAQAWDGLKEL